MRKIVIVFMLLIIFENINTLAYLGTINEADTELRETLKLQLSIN